MPNRNGYSCDNEIYYKLSNELKKDTNSVFIYESIQYENLSTKKILGLKIETYSGSVISNLDLKLAEEIRKTFLAFGKLKDD